MPLQAIFIYVKKRRDVDVVKFTVEILETLARSIKVEAAIVDEALYIVTQRYRNGDIVLDSNDFADVDFNVKAV